MTMNLKRIALIFSLVFVTSMVGACGKIYPNSSHTNAGSEMQSSNKFAKDTKVTSLRIVKDLSLGEDTTRFDYQSMDQSTGILYIAHLGASKVIAFNTKTQQVMSKVEGISDVHGVLSVPKLSTVYATATGLNRVVIIDQKSMQVSEHYPTGNYPDGIAYDPVRHLLILSFFRKGVPRELRKQVLAYKSGKW
jgi:hypothetical protein